LDTLLSANGQTSLAQGKGLAQRAKRFWCPIEERAAPQEVK